ncbi:hypothetical protein BD413DRAFT_15857 [Trametes elegans]|nr:hypothetical protein BD413DRAFT_15857 [Trametes elegans]
MVLTHRGYGAFISCDSKEVETFQVKSKTHVASCYIPSEDGVEYRVHWVDSKPPTHLSVEIRVDGRRIGVISHTKGSSKPGIRLPLEPYEASKFSHASTSEDALPFAYSEDLGTIEVKLRRVHDFVPIPHVPRAPATKNPAPKRSGKHGLEAARRGPSYAHASSSTGRKSATQTRSTILRPILIDDNPYVTFRFLYRPRGRY